MLTTVSVLFEVDSTPQITSKDKARVDEKAQHTLLVCEHFEETRNAVFGR